MTVPDKITIAEEGRALADRLLANCVLPDENEMSCRGLYVGLMVDFEPQTTIERLVVEDLVVLEWEKRRLRRWIQALLRPEIARRMAAALRRSPPKGLRGNKALDALVEEWMNAAPQSCREIEARIRSAGIDPTAVVLEAYEKRIYEVRRFEADLQAVEKRRRRLLDDLRRLQAFRSPEVADAEIVEG